MNQQVKILSASPQPVRPRASPQPPQPPLAPEPGPHAACGPRASAPACSDRRTSRYTDRTPPAASGSASTAASSSRAEPLDHIRPPAHHNAHLADHLCRFSGNDIALADQRVEAEEGRGRHRLPSLFIDFCAAPNAIMQRKSFTNGASHCASNCRSQQAILRRQFLRLHGINFGVRSRQRRIEPRVEFSDGFLDGDPGATPARTRPARTSGCR